LFHPTAVLIKIGQIAVMNINAGSFCRRAAKAMGTQAKGGTVRSNWKIGSKALDINLFCTNQDAQANTNDC